MLYNSGVKVFEGTVSDYQLQKLEAGIFSGPQFSSWTARSMNNPSILFVVIRCLSEGAIGTDELKARREGRPG